ncbi:hypothetical protein BJF93_06830 [Xaviernesmea oryzae]|uniref:Biotin transporter BioY n=1 Tax=Xaviernesmea oryzae TaxID=464029 RepID=A0A1Q9ASF2_9HYPH|nr:hypothetical protein [Xaviernesmea oryzae]OLP58316.1 hypothetical protein BJF93_06830 [Xaviernesmea oryzae]SEL42243.1 hypothetical protein SAMN04487976_10847 [Xaviernesmea oryzae]
MSGLETAIREALSRSDRRSPETRARIYQSARNALEAGLRKQNVTDPKLVEQQRHRLEAAIHAIERDERLNLTAEIFGQPAAGAGSQSPPVTPAKLGPHLSTPASGSPSMSSSDGSLEGLRAERGRASQAPRPQDDDAAFHQAPDDFDMRAEADDHDVGAVDGHAEPSDWARPGQVSPVSRADERTASRSPEPARPTRRGRAAAGPQEPSFAELDEDMVLSQQDRAVAERLLAPEPAPIGPLSRRAERPRRRRRSRFFSFLLVLVTLVCTFGLAGWWAVNGGLMKAAREGVIGQISVRGDDYDPSKGLRQLNDKSGFSAAWQTLFAPDQAAHGVSANPRAVAASVSDEGGQRLRITSSSPDADGAVAIAVPVDILRDLAGKTVTLAVTVQADRGSTTQFSVECDFGPLGNCGRHRFTVNDERTDLLFKTTISARAPTAAGRILINSDVTGSGLGLNLYAVRVMADQ